MPVISSGWHMGMMSLVFFAAMIAATRATLYTSPLGIFRSSTRASVSMRIRTRPPATASLTVGDLAVTSTMRASPFSSMWLKPASVMAMSSDGEFDRDPSFLEE